MEPLWGILENKILWASFTAWFCAQIIKGFADHLKGRKFSMPSLFASGGMPSSHTAFTTCLAMSAGFRAGFSSPEFAVALGLAFIVMYDASGVRYETGNQAEQINKHNEILSKHYPELTHPPLNERLGHTRLQVFWGAVLGCLTAIGFILLFG